MNEYIEKILKTHSAFVNCVKVRSQTSYHNHNYVEIAYVAEGEGVHVVSGKEYSIKKGALFLINYDVEHQFIAKEGGLVVYNCIFAPSYFNEALDKSRNFFDITEHFFINNLYSNQAHDYIFVSASGGDYNRVLGIYERLLGEYAAKQLGYRDIMRGYIIELLVLICRMKMDINSDKAQKMMGILDYINHHYAENISAEELAELAFLSVSHFRRTFKAFTGKTVSHYCQTLRVEEACRLLRSQREMNVEQIAAQVGYHDMKHFYEVFKKITGKTPKSFR